MHKHNVKPSDEQVNYLGIYLSQDAEERIKKARLDRKKFYNDEAYKEKPRKSYTTDDESDFSDTDSGSQGETWTKSPRKEKIESDRSVASSSSSATSSSPPCVSSRAASVADRGDKVGPRHKKEKKNLPGIETRETQYSPVDFVSLHDKYESESESRSTVRVVHVATQEVQASLDKEKVYVTVEEPPRTWFPGATSPSRPAATRASLPPPR